MDNRDEAPRELQETFRQEREERDLEAMKESSAGTTVAPRRRLPLPRGRALAWLIALVALTVIATPLVIAGATFVQSSGIADSVRTFCVDLTDQNYTAAYGLLSHRMAQSVSQAQFANEVQSAHLASCTLNSGWGRYTNNYNISGNRATVRVVFDYADASGNLTTSSDGAMALINEDGGWHVDEIGGLNLGAFQ